MSPKPEINQDELIEKAKQENWLITPTIYGSTGRTTDNICKVIHTTKLSPLPKITLEPKFTSPESLTFGQAQTLGN